MKIAITFQYLHWRHGFSSGLKHILPTDTAFFRLVSRQKHFQIGLGTVRNMIICKSCIGSVM